MNFMRTLLASFSLIIAAPLVAAPELALDPSIKTFASPKEYTKTFQEDKLMITMYTGSHCGPCKIMKPHFIKAAQLHPDIIFSIITVENKTMKEILKANNIQAIPTLIFTKNGKKIMQTSGGLTKAGIESEIKKCKAMLQQQEKSVKKVLPVQRETPKAKKKS